MMMAFRTHRESVEHSRSLGVPWGLGQTSFSIPGMCGWGKGPWPLLAC